MKKLYLPFILLLIGTIFNLYGASDYFPLNGGTNWTYIKYDEFTKRVDTMVVEVTGTEIFDNNEYAVFRSTATQPGPNPYYVSYQYFRKEGNTVYTYEQDTMQVVYRFDLDSGATWKYFPDKTDYNNRNFSVLKRDYSTAINGHKYNDCINIFSNSDYGLDTEINEEFALEVGLIRRYVALAGSWELVSFHLTTDIKDNTLSTSDLSISPNPASDYIIITAPSDAHTLKGVVENVRFYDVFGQDVSDGLHLEGGAHLSPNVRIDVSALPAGVYFVRVGEKVSKFVKM